MANLTILRTYAFKDPAKLPASILFTHSEKTMTIYDAYPKSIFHFLILPRAPSPSSTDPSPDDEPSSPTLPTATPRNPSISDLSNLRALLNSKGVTKDEAKEVILSLKEEAIRLKIEIEQEMEKKYGFVWGVWIGFHALPSMEHMHLHVLSADLISERVKSKKHYNSFHPKLGFFLEVDEVLTWFDAEPSFYHTMAKLSPTKYEPLLKEPLSCFHCHREKKHIPILKSHLQEEWERLRHRAENQRKRKPENQPLEGFVKVRDTDSDKILDVGPAQKKKRRDSS